MKGKGPGGPTFAQPLGGEIGSRYRKEGGGRLRVAPSRPQAVKRVTQAHRRRALAHLAYKALQTTGDRSRATGRRAQGAGGAAMPPRAMPPRKRREHHGTRHQHQT
jgi:hypothetical protein